MTINQRVKQVRQELGLSQAKFAQAISISNGYIAGIELERNKVNDRIVKLVCMIFDVNEEWLKTGEGHMFKEASNPTFDLAVSDFKKLSPEYQDYVLQQIDQLLKIQETQMQKED